MASERYWWPFMSADVEDKVKNCRSCQRHLPSKPHNPPWVRYHVGELLPMEQVSCDHFLVGNKKYLIMVDRYSSYPMMAKVKLMSTDKTASKLTEWFNMLGWPRNIRSDGGPAFWKKFADWCESKVVKFDLSSAYHPQSNGSAEEGSNYLTRCPLTYRRLGILGPGLLLYYRCRS